MGGNLDLKICWKKGLTFLHIWCLVAKRETLFQVEGQELHQETKMLALNSFYEASGTIDHEMRWNLIVMLFGKLWGLWFIIVSARCYQGLLPLWVRIWANMEKVSKSWHMNVRLVSSNIYVSISYFWLSQYKYNSKNLKYM